MWSLNIISKISEILNRENLGGGGALVVSIFTFIILANLKGEIIDVIMRSSGLRRLIEQQCS